MGGTCSAPQQAQPPSEPPADDEADDGASALNTRSPEVMFGALHGRPVPEDAAGLRFAFEVGDRARGWLVDCARGEAIVVSRFPAGAGAGAPPTAAVRYRDAATFAQIETGGVSEMSAMMRGDMSARGEVAKLHALDGVWRDMKKSLGGFEPSPDARTPLLGGGDWDADPELATAKLELARNNVYLYYFYQSLSWGIFVELYTYLATDTICGGDTACGTALGTYNSMLYGLCQFLSNPVMGTISDRIGRRPVFLFGAGADVVVFTLYGVFPTYWGFLLLGGVMGLLDGSNSACFAVIVDCVTRGFMTGAPLPGDSDRELCFTKLLYSCARAPSSREGEPDMNYEFSLIYMVMWAWSLSGMIVGIAISTATVGYLGLAGGMASAGVLLLPYWLYLACYQPETLANSQPLRCRHLCSAFVNQAKSVRLLLHNRRMTLLTLINFISTTAVYGNQNILLYWYEYKFGFGPGDTALILVESLVMLTVWGFLLVRICVKAYGFSASFGWTMFLVGLLYTGQCFVYNGTAVALFGLFTSALWAIQPLVGATATPEIPYEDQGRLQGALYSLQMMANLIGSYGYLRLYIATRGDYSPGTSGARHDLGADSPLFVTAAASVLTAFICFMTPEAKKENQALATQASKPDEETTA